MVINGIAVASFVVPTGSMESTVMTGDFLFVNKFIFGPTTPQVIPFINQPLPFYQFPGYRKPKLNDVIVFIYPGDRDELKPRVFNYYLKRCCGTPGDVVQVKNKQLFVNGKQIPLAKKGQLTEFSFDPVAGFPYNAGYTRDNWGPFKIPKAGEIIEITPQNIAQWAVFVKREGHEISFGNGSVLIDGKPTTKYKVEKNYYFGMGDNRDNSEDSRSWGLIPEENIVGTPIMVYWSWNTDLPINEFFGKIASVRWDRLGTFIR
jgi:signal peptidase I